jgi:tRNA(fMet)-specific endonuclease VapC
VGRRNGRPAAESCRRGPVLTRLLLDTSALIDAERLGADLDELIADEDEPAVAAITIAELGVGVEIATGKRRQARRAFLEGLIEALPIVGYDLEVARAHTQLLVAVRRSGRPRGAHDLLIAATARATRRIVVTVDRSGFDELPGVTVRVPS